MSIDMGAIFGLTLVEENTVRKSKQEALRTRERIVAAASAEFRQHGIVATGLADLMASAGLTHGGFYKHFQSKDELISEAASGPMQTTSKAMKAIGTERPG